MEIIHKNYCSKCKTGSADINYSKTKTKTKLIHYYHCRECNNKRARKYYKENSEKVRQIIYKSIAKHFNKQTCRLETNAAIARGELVRPKACEVCNFKNRRIEAHHPDYEKPLEVNWLCTACHSQFDKEMRANK